MRQSISPEFFPGNTKVLSSSWSLAAELHKVTKHESPQRFVRTLDVYPPHLSLKSLNRILATTDRELHKCADMCQAEVVPHTWGLAHTVYPQIPRGKYAGLGLVAEVDYIDGATVSEYLDSTDDSVPMSVQEQVHEGLKRYNHPLRRINRGHLYDMRPFQFMYGINLNSPDQTDPSLFLVDIEPVFRQKQGGY